MALLLALLLPAFQGCALLPKPDGFKVASSANEYSWHERRYEQLCPQQNHELSVAGCRAAKLWLDRWGKPGAPEPSSDLQEAAAALKRGGAIKYQLRALAKDRREVRKAGVK